MKLVRINYINPLLKSIERELTEALEKTFAEGIKDEVNPFLEKVLNTLYNFKEYENIEREIELKELESGEIPKYFADLTPEFFTPEVFRYRSALWLGRTKLIEATYDLTYEDMLKLKENISSS